MVSLETAEKALKTVYLGAVQDQLNIGVNPLLAKIEQTTSDVWGKEVVKMVPYGLNGGVGSGSETGELPEAVGNSYQQFRIDLKNLYGTIEISDKAIQASQHSAGAFVNLLNAEMDGLLKASKFNLGRMLYGDGSGVVSEVKAYDGNNVFKVSAINNLMIGMRVDLYSYITNEIYPNIKGRKIVNVDRGTGKITLDGPTIEGPINNGDLFTVQNSKDKEITGLGAIFSSKDIYGLKRSENSWLNPYMSNNNSINTDGIQSAIDYVEENSGGSINYIVTTYDMRRKYMNYLSQMRMNLDYMNLDGGYKALSYNGIPVVADKFAPLATWYLINTDDFKMHQLADWRWLEGDGGKVIKQKVGTPTYTATLVKYAELICDKPLGQAKITINI